MRVVLTDAQVRYFQEKIGEMRMLHAGGDDLSFAQGDSMAVQIVDRLAYIIGEQVGGEDAE